MGRAERAALENYNYWHDRRVVEALVDTGLVNINTRTRTAEFHTEGANNEKVVHTIGLRWEVCHICNGDGKHMDPSIDAGGLTEEDFEEDPDLRARYLRGEYDMTCGTCHGRTTVPTPCRNRTSAEAWRAYQAYLRDERDYARMVANERAMGC